MNIERLTHLKNKLDQFRPIPPSLLDTINKKFKLEWTYHSNAIEGNTLTLQETAFFLREGLTSKGKTLQEYLEAQNHAEAIDYLQDIIKENGQITESLIKELHALLMKGINTILTGTEGAQVQIITPGKYKTKPNHVLTLDGELHYYCDPVKVPEEMEKLVAMINYKNEDMHSVELAARVHHRFVALHPFDDGNGRVARILMNLLLMKEGYPPVVIKNEKREEYYKALMEADRGNIDPFLNLIANELENSLSVMLEIVTR